MSAIDQTAAETALLLEKEINKRVALALDVLLQPSTYKQSMINALDSEDAYSVKTMLAGDILEAICDELQAGVHNRFTVWIGEVINRHIEHAFNHLAIVQTPTTTTSGTTWTSSSAIVQSGNCPSCGRP